ncbi:uncharacterized protein LOC110676395 isoform X2 [Aedes aegypti]|uniref:Uncharacterized protein n=1 Tax=Aedes aegypti TaxID=7159 RepID=A0A6I8U7D7_AEDAE|nr:uncharacterized protein LOC110676395 isoform X2 [Aedes aegypti]
MATSQQSDSSKYKQQFLQKYNELVESINSKHFEEYQKVAPKHRAFEIFKAGLLENILSYFNGIWDSTNTDEHLHILDLLKADPKNDSEKKWRPTGKSAEEQVRPLVINKLKWQIKMYERQIQFHKQQLERAVSQVELGRKKWADFVEMRESLKSALTSEMQDFKNIECQITALDETVIDDLQREQVRTLKLRL